MFLVVMLLLWTLLTALIAGNGHGMPAALPLALGDGLSGGYWIVGGLALFDRLSREFAKGEMSRYLFALFALPFLMAMWAFIGKGPTSLLPFDLQQTISGPLAAAPFLAVAVCYMARADRLHVRQITSDEGEAA